MLIKICGITKSSELKMLDNVGVDYAGLWFNIPQGNFNLDYSDFVALANTKLNQLRCVGVTTESNSDTIESYIKNTNINAIQLHGFQLPNQVRSIRNKLDNKIKIFKVLHIQAGKCLESAILDQYINCGADYFILDNFISNERPGSTGECIPVESINNLINYFGSKRIFLAGGINNDYIKNLKINDTILGVDIDSGARQNSIINKHRVQQIIASNIDLNHHKVVHYVR